MKAETHTLLDRIRLILIEETNKSRDLNEFIDDASLRLLEVIQDEKQYNRYR